MTALIAVIVIIWVVYAVSRRRARRRPQPGAVKASQRSVAMDDVVGDYAGAMAKHVDQAKSRKPKRTVPVAATPTGSRTSPGDAVDTTASISIPGEQSGTGVPIPPRPIAPSPGSDRASQIPNTTSGLSVSIRFTTPMSAFVDEARKHANRRGAKAPHVTLHSYWTTYQSMDAAQSRWYFYWRDQFRRGVALETDLSYIFVFVYECLHLAGFRTAQDALESLSRVWASYRKQHPKLIRYVLPWSQDLGAYYGLDESAVELALRCFGEDAALADADLWIHRWLIDQQTDELDLQQMYLLSGFDPRTGKFVTQPGRAEELTVVLRDALAAANGYYLETLGVPMFHVLFRNLPHGIVERPAFAGAVFGDEPKVVRISAPPPYTTSAGREVVAGVLRFAENRLRAQAGFRGSRRGDLIDADLQRHLVARLGLETPGKGSTDAEEQKPVLRPRTVALDPERLAQLTRESSEIRSRLAQEAGALGDEHAVFVDPRFEIPADTPAGQLTDVPRVAAILDALAAPTRRLLQNARTVGWEFTTTSHESAMEIVETSIQHLGEPLLVSEGTQWVVVDDYRDELAFLLEHPLYAETRSPEPDVTVIGNPKDSEGPQAFNAAPSFELEAVHMTVMMMLLEKRPASELRSFAMQNSLMVDVLLDEINERLEAVAGDLVLNTSEDPPSIYAEHVRFVESLVG